MGNMKKQKVRFIQLEFYTIHDEPSDYMVIIEVVDDVPLGALFVRLTLPYTLLPHYPFIKN